MNSLINAFSRFFLLLLILIPVFSPKSQAQNPDSGLIVTPDTLASQIAMEILKNGGNAVDAGVAALFALSVVQPYSTGIGGGGFMLIKMNQGSEPIVIDFREQAPRTADLAIFYQDAQIFNIYTEYGFRSICVPGMIAGVEKALIEYGKMTLQQVLEPVIALASDGFPVSENLSNLIATNYDLLETNRTTSAVFMPDWLPLNKGQNVKREDLAKTFGLLALHGAKAFYQGEIATAICSEIRLNNGILKASDFQAYQPRLRKPVQGRYHNLEILSVPPPGSGGAAIIELLTILEKFNLGKLQLNSGPYIHLVAEAMKQVYHDREQYFLGDPEVDRLNPARILTSRHIDQCFSQIDSTKVIILSNQPDDQLSRESSGGSHISVPDRYGISVSISSTLNGFFGSAVTIPEYGILLNNAMYNFSQDSSAHNALKPGKRPQTTLAPTILLKNQQPFLILGGTGAERIISMLSQIIINVVEFKLPLAEAVRTPRFHYDYYTDTIEMETRIEANSIEYLKQLGHKIHLTKDFDVYFGSAQVILYDAESDTAIGVSDVRQAGVVYIK